MAKYLLSSLLFILTPLLTNSCQPEESKERQQTTTTMDSDLTPPTAVTKDLFAQWRSARRGKQQAERMDNPVWEWMLREEVGTYSATQHFQLGSAFDLGPGWCSQRYGQSETLLPDGRVILIAGEHEDYYDPDFYIYNDVIVKNPDGSTHFYSYPEEDFTPTDFHSATLLDEQIILIGNLGYLESRRPGETLVQSLSLKDFHIRKIETKGNCPGWIGNHRTEYFSAEKKVIVSGGETFGDDGSLLENIDDWELDLSIWTWKRLTERKWTRVEFSKADRGWMNLFEMRNAQFMEVMRKEHASMMTEEMKTLFDSSGIEGEDDELLGEPAEDSVFTPPEDPEVLASLYQPNLDFKEVSKESEEDYDVFQILVDDVTVRYNEKGSYLVMTVEGELPSQVVESLVKDLKAKLSKLLKSEIQTRVY